MKTYTIAVIPGDGIGPEVIREGMKIVTLISEQTDLIRFEFVEFPWGCEYYLDNGVMMPENGIDMLSKFDAIYLGAVGFPGVPDHVSLWGLLLEIRKSFDQYINLRPVYLLDECLNPFKTAHEAAKTEITFIRENKEGEYSGSGAWLYKNTPQEVVIQNAVFSRMNTERTMRYAFELAKKENKRLTNVSKGNALNYSMVFWDSIFEELKDEYPYVQTETLLVDAASMFLVTDPKRFEVVVTTNLFGDILTDLGAALTGGLGIATGANINPERKYPSMFEPVHGSAPQIANRGIANPLAAIWSVSQMLDHFGYEELGKIVLDSIKEVIKEGQFLTLDLGGSASTSRVGEAVQERIKEKVQVGKL